MVETENGKKYRLHLRLCLQGAVLNFKAKEWKKSVRDDNGKWLEPMEVKRYFIECLAEGKKFLPVGDCNLFSYETGCPGHPMEEEK